MSQGLSLAQIHVFDLVQTLKVPVTLFHSGSNGVLPNDEIDAADDLDIISEFDPCNHRPVR